MIFVVILFGHQSSIVRSALLSAGNESANDGQFTFTFVMQNCALRFLFRVHNYIYRTDAGRRVLFMQLGLAESISQAHKKEWNSVCLHVLYSL